MPFSFLNWTGSLFLHETFFYFTLSRSFSTIYFPMSQTAAPLNIYSTYQTNIHMQIRFEHHFQSANILDMNIFHRYPKPSVVLLSFFPLSLFVCYVCVVRCIDTIDTFPRHIRKIIKFTLFPSFEIDGQNPKFIHTEHKKWYTRFVCWNCEKKSVRFSP